jgi:hypothetical protein
LPFGFVLRSKTKVSPGDTDAVLCSSIDPDLSRRHGRKRHLKLERFFRRYRHGASTEWPLVAQPREKPWAKPLRLNNQGWGLCQSEAPGNGFLDRDRLHGSFPSKEQDPSPSRATGSQIDRPGSRESLGYLVRGRKGQPAADRGASSVVALCCNEGEAMVAHSQTSSPFSSCRAAARSAVSKPSANRA